MVSTMTCSIGLIFVASSALLTGTFASGDRVIAKKQEGIEGGAFPEFTLEKWRNLLIFTLEKWHRMI